MTTDDTPFTRPRRSAADWFVEIDRGGMSTQDERALGEWLARDPGNEAALTRCHAAASMTSSLRARPTLEWAFQEAAVLAAGRVRENVHAARPWHQRPGLAWAVAGVAVAVAAAALLRSPAPHAPPEPATAGMEPLVAGNDASAFLAIDVPFFDPAALLPGDGEVVVDARSVAVLPFRDSTSEDSGGGLRLPEIAAALNEEIARRLAELPGVYVVARQATLGYSSEELAPEDIAAQLGVRGVVEGWIDAEAGRVRLYLRLTDAANDAVVDRAFDQPLDALAALPGDVVETIALTLNTPPRSARHVSLQIGDHR